MLRLCFAVRLEIAVRQFCELGSSTFVTPAIWLTSSKVPGNRHAGGECRLSKTYKLFDVEVSQAQNSRELALPNVYQA